MAQLFSSKISIKCVSVCVTCLFLQGIQHGDIKKTGKLKERAIYYFDEIKIVSGKKGRNLYNGTVLTLCKEYAWTLE